MSKRSPAKAPNPNQAGNRRMDPIEEENQDPGSSASTPPRSALNSDVNAISRTPSTTAIVRKKSNTSDKASSNNLKGLSLSIPSPTQDPVAHTTAINQSTSISDLFMNMSVPSSDVNDVDVLSPASYDYKKNKRFLNKFDSAIRFLNGSQTDFFTVSKNDFSLYTMDYEVGEEPVVELFKERKFRVSTTDPIEYNCRCIAMDNTLDNMIAFGFNNGDIFISKAYQDAEPDTDWYNYHHIRMNHKCESLVQMAWDRSTHGKTYLCAAYERGRGNEHLINLFDISQGQQRDLFSERQIAEPVHDMAFLNVELSTLLLSCGKNFRFIDIRERTGFMNITSVNSPLLKIALEPYNNVQFAGANGNLVTIYDKRYLSKALYEIRVGTKDFNITHLEYNPNRYGNISCSSTTSGVIYELDISPKLEFAHHFTDNKSVDVLKSSVNKYVQNFSYGVKEINTSLKQVQEFRWCHSKRDLMVVICPRVEEQPEQEGGTDQLIYKTVIVDHNRTNACFGADGSIVFSSNNNISEIKPKLKVRLQKKKTVGFSDPDETESQEKKEGGKTVFEDNRARVYDIQRNVPFKQPVVSEPLDAELQFWFTKGDINRMSYARAMSGYGFGKSAGSARALIESSHKAVKDEKDESHCLKECWKLLIRVYLTDASSRFQQKYGTLFPGISRLSRNMKSTTMVKDDPVTFRNKYYLGKNRDDILRLCGWTALEDHNGLASRLERLMNSNDVDDKIKAAAMAMFSLQGPACKSYLQKTYEYLKSGECQSISLHMIQSYQHMIDLVIRALDTYDGIKLQNYEDLIKEVDQPYLMSMVRFIGRRQHSYLVTLKEIVAINEMSVADRIAFIAIHADDQIFKDSLKRLNNSVLLSDNPLAVLLISGLDDHKQSHIAIQTYLQQTNDIQTAALLLCAGNCFRRSKIWESYDMRKSVQERIKLAITKNALKNTRKYSLQIVLQYMQWLQTSQLILQKSFIMTFLRKKLEFPPGSTAENKAKKAQNIIACNFCGKPILPYINGDDTLSTPAQKSQAASNQRSKLGQGQNVQRTAQAHPPPARTNGCPHHECSKPLPCCTICKKSCNQQVESHSINTQMEDWFIWCTKCCHGGHLKHLREWFDSYDICPAGDCDCECPNLDTVFKANIKTKRKHLPTPELLEGMRLRTVTGFIQKLDDEEEEEEQARILKKLATKGQTALKDYASKNGKRRKSLIKPLRQTNSEEDIEFDRVMVPEVLLSNSVMKSVGRAIPESNRSRTRLTESDDDGETLKADSPGDDLYLRPDLSKRSKRSISECIAESEVEYKEQRSNSSIGDSKDWMVTRVIGTSQAPIATEAQITPNLPCQRNVSQDNLVKSRLIHQERAPVNAKFIEHIYILPQKQDQIGYSTDIQRNRLHQAIVSQAIYEQVEKEQKALHNAPIEASVIEVQDILSDSDDNDDEAKEVDRLVRFNQRVFNEYKERNQKKKSQNKDLQTIRTKLGSPKQLQRKISEPSRLPSKANPPPDNELKPQSQSPGMRH